MRRFKYQNNSKLPITKNNIGVAQTHFSVKVILFITIFIALGLAIGFLFAFLPPLIWRKKNVEDNNISSILLQELPEKSLTYKYHTQDATRTIEFCEVQPLTESKIHRLFNNSRIAVHHNCPEEVPENLQRIAKQLSFLGVSKDRYSKFNTHQIIARLKKDFVFTMQEAHPVVQRLISIYLTSARPTISIYTRSPNANISPIPIAGSYVIANDTLRLTTKAAPSMIMPHEFAHAGAAKITYRETLWSNAQFRYPLTAEKINSFIAKTFPCDQDNFYEIWEQEVNEILNKEELFNNPSLTSDEINLYDEFLDVAKDYTPQFGVWLSEKNLSGYAKQLKINNTVTLGSFSSFSFAISPQLSKYETDFIPEGISSQAYYQNVLLNKPVRIVSADHDTELPGIAKLQVIPLTMEPKVKAYYLLKKFGFMKSYADIHKHLSGHCQEAFAVSFELNKEVLDRTLPMTMEYLEKRLDDYEDEVCGQSLGR